MFAIPDPARLPRPGRCSARLRLPPRPVGRVPMKASRAALLVVLSGLCGVAASAVHAQQPNALHQSEAAWKTMDKCKRQAWRQYPDYTREASAKREVAMTQCLRPSNAPPG